MTLVEAIAEANKRGLMVSLYQEVTGWAASLHSKGTRYRYEHAATMTDAVEKALSEKPDTGLNLSPAPERDPWD